MPRYRVIDPEQNVIDEKEFADDTKAYDWFKTIEVPDDSLGYAMQVDILKAGLSKKRCLLVSCRSCDRNRTPEKHRIHLTIYTA